MSFNSVYDSILKFVCKDVSSCILYLCLNLGFKIIQPQTKGLLEGFLPITAAAYRFLPIDELPPAKTVHQLGRRIFREN